MHVSLAAYFQATYTYDATGQRTSSVVRQGSVTTTSTYTYGGLTLLSLDAESTEGTAAASWRIDYLTDATGRPYGGIYTSSETSAVAFGIVTTDRGDVRELTDGAGTPFARYDHDAYGNPTRTLTAATADLDAATAAVIAGRNILRYAGYAFDEHSGLYYLSQRYYDPATCQFITKDPAKADGEESAYQYCGGDPVGKVDPSGEMSMVRVGYYGVRTNRQVTLGDAWWTIFKQNAAYARKAGVWGWSAYALGAVGAASRLAWFGNMVRSNGRWDLKRRLDYRNSYHFAGKWRRYDDIGNLMYGFVGRAYGLSLTTLQGAGGIAQIIARTSKWSFWKTYFDDPRDSAAVREGYNLYASTPRASYNGVIYVAWL